MNVMLLGGAPGTNRLIRQALAAKGHSLTVATSVEEAHTLGPDKVIIDLPTEGVDAVLKLQQDGYEGEIVFLAGAMTSLDATAEALLRKYAVSAILHHPLRIEELVNAVTAS